MTKAARAEAGSGGPEELVFSPAVREMMDGEVVADELLVDDETATADPDDAASGREGAAAHQGAGERSVVTYGTRREARERALSLLYEADAKAIAPSAILAEIPVEPPPYVTSLVSGVGDHLAAIDQLMARYAIDWTIDRMPVVDRLLVRMATFELLCRPDVPTGVVMSEAVELAKRYSTEESSRFVNGLLASISAEIRPTAGS